MLPGEEVDIQVERAKNDLLRGRLVEMCRAGASASTPGCPYFQRCGGCQYQHANYEYQVEQKQAILREVLRRVGKIDYDAEIDRVTSEPWSYRNRTQLHIENGAVGYFESDRTASALSNTVPFPRQS